MKFIKFIILGVVSALVGCSTMIDGSEQEISIDSNPQGAKVYVAKRAHKDGPLVDKFLAGETPTVVSIARKDGVVIIVKEGYKTLEVPLEKRINGTFALDVTFLSLLSTSIDISTGAIHEYDPGKYIAELVPLDEVGVSESN